MVRRAVELNCQRFVEALRARSELLRDAEREGFVAMFGAMYEVGSGDLGWLDFGHPSSPAGHAAPAGESIDAHGHADDSDTHLAHGLDAHAHDHESPHGDDHGHADDDHLTVHPSEDAHGHAGTHDEFFIVDGERHEPHEIEPDGYVTPDEGSGHGHSEDSLLTTLLGAFAVASFGVAVILMSSNSQLRKRVSVLAAAVTAQSEQVD